MAGRRKLGSASLKTGRLIWPCLAGERGPDGRGKWPYAGTLHSSEEGSVYWIPIEAFKEKELATGMDYVLQMMESEQINECYMHLKDEKYVGTLY